MRSRRRIGLDRLGAALLVPLGAGLLLWTADKLFPFPREKLAREPAVLVSDRDGVPLRLFLPTDEQWRLPVSFENLPPELPQALIASEDRFFYVHSGVNPLAILRAAWKNLRAGRVASGASTIPMQIARMVEPAPRTLRSKLAEALRALQLDLHYSKRELLEIYLNLAPYGGNLEGVGAASSFYFGKDVSQLSIGEVALLTALPRSPARYDPVQHPRAAAAVRKDVLLRLRRRGLISEREVANALLQPLPAERRPVPFVAPHLARLAADLRPGSQTVSTTLDRRVQAVAESMIGRRIVDLRARGISNAAVVVIENRTRAVRAMVGSVGFFERLFSGQVNGAMARRSPGSTLKPFLYAQALDAGVILPESFLLDVPTDFAGYSAENYDGRFQGRVTARQALVESLNVPAVRLLSRLGLEQFHQLLLAGGVESLDRKAGEYGLPLVLGGGEATLLELTNLYASLAEGGVHRPASIFRDGLPVGKGDRLMSAEAAWLVTEILMDVERPDLPRSWDLTRDAPGVAWKTGTSYGHRDAWAVGFSREYTVGVWVGNFDGKARKGISGSEHAAPILFDLFRSLEPGGVGPQKRPGLRIETFDGCDVSHQLPGPYCPKKTRLTYLPGRSRLARCAIHRRARVDSMRGERLAGNCAGEAGEWQVFAVFPPELVSWWRERGERSPGLPVLAASCDAVPAEDPPRIVSPDAATPYRVRRESPIQFQRIPLDARVGDGVERLFWYQDGLLVASAPPGGRVFLPTERGLHRLVVTDDLGRSDALTYRVE